MGCFQNALMIFQLLKRESKTNKQQPYTTKSPESSGTRSTTRIIHAVMMDLSSTNSKPQTTKQWNSICRSRVLSFDAAIMNGYNFIFSNTWLSRMHSSRAFSRRWNTLSAQTCEFEIAHEELSKRSNPPHHLWGWFVNSLNGSIHAGRTCSASDGIQYIAPSDVTAPPCHSIYETYRQDCLLPVQDEECFVLLQDHTWECDF